MQELYQASHFISIASFPICRFLNQEVIKTEHALGYAQPAKSSPHKLAF